MIFTRCLTMNPQAGDYVNELLLLVSGTAEIRSRVAAYDDDGPGQVGSKK